MFSQQAYANNRDKAARRNNIHSSAGLPVASNTMKVSS